MSMREKWIVAVMCLTLVYGAYELLGKSMGTGRATQPPGSDAPLEEVRRFAEEMSRKADEQVISDADRHVIAQALAPWTNDPFIASLRALSNQPGQRQGDSTHATATSSGPPDFAFTGFLRFGETRMAIINGLEYARGEALGTDGFYVHSISEQRVVLRKVGSAHQIVLPLREMD